MATMPQRRRDRRARYVTRVVASLAACGGARLARRSSMMQAFVTTIVPRSMATLLPGTHDLPRHQAVFNPSSDASHHGPANIAALALSPVCFATTIAAASLWRRQGYPSSGQRLPALRCQATGGTSSSTPESSLEGTANEKDEGVRQLLLEPKEDGPEMPIGAASPQDPQETTGPDLFAAAAGSVGAGAAALVGPPLIRLQLLQPLRDAADAAVQPLADSYAIPIIAIGIPSWFLHWSHGGNTLAVVVILGGLGVAEGFARRQRRLSQASSSAPSGVDHASLMAATLLLTLIGAAGGLASLRFDGQPILQSPHFWSALVSFALLLGNALVSTRFSGDPESSAKARDLHSKLGVAWVASVAVSAVLGLALGTSYEGAGTIKLDEAPPIGNSAGFEPYVPGMSMGDDEDD